MGTEAAMRMGTGYVRPRGKYVITKLFGLASSHLSSSYWSATARHWQLPETRSPRLVTSSQKQRENLYDTWSWEVICFVMYSSETTEYWCLVQNPSDVEL